MSQQFVVSVQPFPTIANTSASKQYSLGNIIFNETGSGGGTTYTLSCLGGTYSYTGTSATLTLGSRGVFPTPGSYSYTGTSSSFAVKLSAKPVSGSYTYTGTSATLTNTPFNPNPPSTGLYAADGSWNVTLVTGTTYTGLYSNSGGYNIVFAPGNVYVGAQHPCGALWVTTAPSSIYPTPARAPDGSLYVSVSPYVNGGQRITLIGLSLPSGAIGIWDSANYVATSKTIPNSAVSASLDASITKAPRRLFSRGGWWGNHSLVTVTDANTTAPDGSNDATTVTASANTAWFMQGQTTKLGTAITNGQIYTVAISVQSLSGGNLNFALGNSQATAIKTATPSWQRFTYTFTASTSSTTWLFKSPDGVQLANFAICDWQVFAGSSDLNTNWATLAPQSFLNMDAILDRDTSTVSSNAFQPGSHASIHMATSVAITPSAFTFMYVAKETGTPNNIAYDPIIATLELSPISFNTFAIGPAIDSGVGSRVNGTTIDSNPTSGAVNNCFAPNTWGGASLNDIGPYVAVHRFTGTQASAFINSVKLLDHAVTATPVAFTDLGVGYLFNGLNGGNQIYYMAYWPRALSDVEVRAAYNYIKTKKTLGSPRTSLFCGTSISINSTTYALQAGPLLNPASYGCTWGSSGSNIDQWNGYATTPGIDNIMTGPPSQRYILSMEIGANDLGIRGHYAGNVSGFLTALASFLDARRAAGWKVVATTVLARLDQSDGGTQFNLDRATVNSTIRTWVGTHCDAVADWAADPTMGTDTAPNNTTYFGGDKVHPTEVGFAILAPISAAAINSIT